MHVVISEAKKFTVIDYFIAFFCKVFSVIEMLKEVSDCMTACWNPPTPITELFQQLNDEKDLSEEGNEIINDRKLLCLCYDKVHASVLFSKTLKNLARKSRY